jgi:hypothetical protein
MEIKGSESKEAPGNLFVSITQRQVKRKQISRQKKEKDLTLKFLRV